MTTYKCPKEVRTKTFGNVTLKREKESQILRETRRSRRTDMFNSKRNIVIESPQKEIKTRKATKLNMATEKAEKLKKWREEKMKRKAELKERPPFNRYVQVRHTGLSPYRPNYISNKPSVIAKTKNSSLTRSQKPSDNKGAIFPLKGYVPFTFQLTGPSNKGNSASKETSKEKKELQNSKLPPRQTKQVVLNRPVTRSNLTNRTAKPVVDSNVAKKAAEVKPAKPIAAKTINPIIASYKGNLQATRRSTRRTMLNEQKVNPARNVKKSIVIKPVQNNRPVLKERKIGNERRTLIVKQIDNPAEKNNSKAVTGKKSDSDKENSSVPPSPKKQDPIITLDMECVEETPLRVTSRTRKSKRIALTPVQIKEKLEEPPNGITFQRNRLEKETARLLNRAQTWDEISSSTRLPEKISDEIDSVVGQTRLLTNNKFQQFKGLIDKCESKAQNITFDDLDGFWEMMYIQVEQLDEKYNNLLHLRENEWKTPAHMKKRPNRKRLTRKRKSTLAKMSSPAIVRSTRKSVFDLNPSDLTQIVNSPKALTPASHINLINAQRTSRSSFGSASLRVSIKSKEVMTPQ